MINEKKNEWNKIIEREIFWKKDEGKMVLKFFLKFFSKFVTSILKKKKKKERKRRISQG